MATEKRLISADDVLEVLCNYCGVEGCCPEGGCAEYQKISKLSTVDAVVLPCKIGDKVYRIVKGNDYIYHREPFVQELTVTEISWKKEKYGDKDLGFAIIADGIRYKFTSIGKSVFLTRKEAEAKMDGERKDNA